MKALIKTITLCLAMFIFLPANLVAQPNDQRLAKHYFDSGEFEKALLYYQKFYNQQPSDFNYKTLLKTLNALENFKESEKLIKKQRKRSPGKQSYELDMANVLELTGEQEKANHIYAKLIKDVPLNYRSILELGEAFREKDLLNMALEVYQKGKESVKSYPFGFKTAELHGKLGDNTAMLEDYIDVVVAYNNYVPSVQSVLSRTLDFEDPKNPKTDELRITLLKKMQSDPDELTYNEMLIWYFLQIKDFNGAMIQVKAMDRRLKNSNGEDVMQLSRVCRANRAYDIAIKGYQYVIEKYPGGYHYNNARLESMTALNDKITNSKYSQEDLTLLESKFEEILKPDEMGKTSVTVPMMRNLAHLEAFYLQNRTKAISLLKEALEIPRISYKERGLCKMELGDVYVMQGRVWDASIQYLQVEKEFKEDILGHEAKFRNSKIHYYTGNFEYAQAQLDVLKASTSKLISNDAMQLSLLITDNVGLDTTLKPMMLFAQADLYIFQNRHEEALLCLDSITDIYGEHALSDEILFKKHEIAKKNRDWNQSMGYLSKLLTNHALDILGDDALYEMAQICQYQLQDYDKAKEYYKKIIFDYPGSFYTAESRKQFRELGGGSDSEDIKIIGIDKDEIEMIDGTYDDLLKEWPKDPSVKKLQELDMSLDEFLRLREQMLRQSDEERYEREEAPN
jgi:tetratricopeptide (TPR) repeat protein